MADPKTIHPPVDRLSAYALGQLDGPERDEIERHVSSCDACCRAIEDQPGDALVLKLRDRGARATAAGEESAGEPAGASPIPSSFPGDPDEIPPLHDRPTGPPGLAGLPRELNDHPRYRVVAAIGAGGMGAVYRAEHRLMDRPVALKVIRSDLLGSAAMVERFRREVRAAARLASHPNIVAAYDAEQAGEAHFLVMEFVEGTDLAELVERRGPLPVGEACEYARQAALGLQHAFEDRMVHRDIKPQNLMRTTRGQVKVLDFGLARFASEAAPRGGMTAQGMVLGSADYIAPEQIDDPHAADIRADIYSLGCTLYFLLAGHPPFPDGSLIRKLTAHREKTPRPLVEIRADMPPELAPVVARMMAKDPAQRFSTPDEVARALAPFADGRDIATARADAPTLQETSPRNAPSVTDGTAGPRATHSGQPRRRTWLRIATALAILPIVVTLLSWSAYRLKRGDKAVVTVRREVPTPAPTSNARPASDLRAGAGAGELARLPGPHDLPEPAGTIVVLATSQYRGAPSLVYAWDGKSHGPTLLFSLKSRLVQQLHAFAVGRDGRQYYLCENEPTLVEADKDGEKRIFTHNTYVRDLALDEDDNIYFSEASGAHSDGKIYRLVPATDRAAARVELFYTIDLGKVSGRWSGNFAFGRDAKGKVDTNTLYLSSGNHDPASIYRITRDQGRWSDPTRVYQAGGNILGLVFTSPAAAYYVADNHVFRLTAAGSKVAFIIPGVSGLCHVAFIPEGNMIKPGGNPGIAR
jgi:serine/threonine protein kinase